MAVWFKNQYDINFRTNIFNVTTIKTFFKRNDSIGPENLLIEDSECTKIKPRSESFHNIVVRKRCKNNKNIDTNKNEFENQPIWRRLSVQSFRKRKQRKHEERSKPMIPPVLRTYDKRGAAKDSNWL